ncbi:MAG: OBAP family protein [Phycisphaerae bacterium]|nr:OBAP family protein [Phycisphaerae bacterium]
MASGHTSRAWMGLLIAAAVGLTAGMLIGPGRTSAQGGGHDHGGTKRSEHWTGPDRMHLYLCAFHIAKENPKFQVEAHHYCSPQGGDLHQCVIYDACTGTPKLLGVEYIITDAAYQSLPAEEKKYWHPHAYEILSGQLVAPDAPKMGDDMFPGLINTWGKTWHTWRDPSTTYPVGEPLLMWSANGDGQIDPKLVDRRDAHFGIKSADIRERRKSYGFEVPQLPPPKSMAELGRRWTMSGPDVPTKSAGAMK